MKRTIRLTESDLRRLVEGALNELDWKTYANAAKKQSDIASDEWRKGKRDRDNWDKFRRADHFSDAAARSFTDKHGSNGYDTLFMNPEETQYLRYDDDDVYGGENYIFGHGGKGYETTRDGENFADHKYEDEYGYDDPAVRDLSGYYSGKSKYTKGKGWNESRNRRLTNRITESIIRRLKR